MFAYFIREDALCITYHSHMQAAEVKLIIIENELFCKLWSK